MNKYLIIDKLTSEVSQIMQWGDNREFPSNWGLKENEEVITVDSNNDVELTDMYDSNMNKFYIQDVTDNEQKILEDTDALSQLQNQLSDFQEETWKLLGIDETKLSQEWQDLLAKKRTLRASLLALSK